MRYRVIIVFLAIVGYVYAQWPLYPYTINYNRNKTYIHGIHAGIYIGSSSDSDDIGRCILYDCNSSLLSDVMRMIVPIAIHTNLMYRTSFLPLLSGTDCEKICEQLTSSLVIHTRTLVVLTTCNHIDATLSSLHALRHQSDDFDIVVIDDFSVDGTPDILIKQGYFVIGKASGQGLTDSWNIAYRLAKLMQYEYIIFANNDVLVPDKVVGDLVESLDNPRHPVVVPLTTRHACGHNPAQSINNVHSLSPSQTLYSFSKGNFNRVQAGLSKRGKEKNDTEKLLLSEWKDKIRFNGFFFAVNIRNIAGAAYNENNLFDPNATMVFQEDLLTTRMMSKGQFPAINKYTFVYHEKSVTVKNLYVSLLRGFKVDFRLLPETNQKSGPDNLADIDVLVVTNPTYDYIRGINSKSTLRVVLWMLDGAKRWINLRWLGNADIFMLSTVQDMELMREHDDFPVACFVKCPAFFQDFAQTRMHMPLRLLFHDHGVDVLTTQFVQNLQEELDVDIPKYIETEDTKSELPGICMALRVTHGHIESIYKYLRTLSASFASSDWAKRNMLRVFLINVDEGSKSLTALMTSIVDRLNGGRGSKFVQLKLVLSGHYQFGVRIRHHLSGMESVDFLLDYFKSSRICEWIIVATPNRNFTMGDFNDAFHSLNSQPSDHRSNILRLGSISSVEKKTSTGGLSDFGDYMIRTSLYTASSPYSSLLPDGMFSQFISAREYFLYLALVSRMEKRLVGTMKLMQCIR